MLAVSNTSPIFNLACINHLNLVREQFGDVWIPDAVDAELRNVPDSAVLNTIEQARRAGWLRTRHTTNLSLVSLLTVELHPGEAEAIALALEIKAGYLLIDERDGRLLARQLGLRLTGVLGVLLRAKRTGRIQSLKAEIDALRTQARFFIASGLEKAILAEGGE
jgi:hypothetical protein